MLKKIASSFLFAGLCVSAFANEDSTAPVNPLNISGFVDVYYKYDFAKTASNNYTSFTGANNSFALGMASVKLDKTIGKVGFVADLGFGQRAKDFAYNDDGITAAIKQLYVSYSPIESLKFTVGSWATHVGYELVDAPGNRNYSMSYMFSHGPFFHTGLKAEYSFGNSTIMAGIANPTDTKVGDYAPRMFLGQFATATANEKLKFYLNYVGGRGGELSRSGQFDAVILGTITDKFSVGYNGTVASGRSKANTTAKWDDANSWWGSALYLNLDPTPSFGLTLRNEYFSDKKGLLGTTDDNDVYMPFYASGSVFATTLSGNIKVGPLTIIPEVRLDQASKDGVFMNKDGASSKTAFNALVAAVFAF